MGFVVSGVSVRPFRRLIKVVFGLFLTPYSLMAPQSKLFQLQTFESKDSHIELERGAASAPVSAFGGEHYAA